MYSNVFIIVFPQQCWVKVTPLLLVTASLRCHCIFCIIVMSINILESSVLRESGSPKT